MSVVAEGRFTFADLWSGSVLAMRRLLILTSLAGAIVLAEALLLTFRNEGGALGHLRLYAIGVFFLVYMWPFVAYGCWKTVKHSPNLQGVVRYEFGDGGYRVEGAQAKSEVNWTALVKWKEGSKTILLYANPRIGSVVPKRFFRSAADLETVRGYLSANVKKKG